MKKQKWESIIDVIKCKIERIMFKFPDLTIFTCKNCNYKTTTDNNINPFFVNDLSDFIVKEMNAHNKDIRDYTAKILRKYKIEIRNEIEKEFYGSSTEELIDRLHKNLKRQKERNEMLNKRNIELQSIVNRHFDEYL